MKLVSSLSCRLKSTVVQEYQHMKGVLVSHPSTVDLRVSRQRGVVAVSALRHTVGVQVKVEVRVLRRRKSEVGVLPCLEVAEVLPRQRPAATVHPAVVVHLQLAVVVQVLEVAVEVVLRVVVVAAVLRQHLAAVRVARLHRAAAVVHLLLHRLQQLGMIHKKCFSIFICGMFKARSATV